MLRYAGYYNQDRYQHCLEEDVSTTALSLVGNCGETAPKRRGRQMNENAEGEQSEQEQSEQEQSESLRPLMTDTERKAARALVENSTLSGTGVRREMTDTIFRALAHPGRRYILTYLLRSEGYVTMTDLVDYVMERAHPVNSEDFRRRVTVQLTHTHLPQLDDDGLVNYNMERQLVSQTEKTQLAAPFLKVALAQQEELAGGEIE